MHKITSTPRVACVLIYMPVRDSRRSFMRSADMFHWSRIIGNSPCVKRQREFGLFLSAANGAVVPYGAQVTSVRCADSQPRDRAALLTSIPLDTNGPGNDSSPASQLGRNFLGSQSVMFSSADVRRSMETWPSADFQRLPALVESGQAPVKLKLGAGT